jgi:uracil-DNA glycosylase
MSRPTYNLGMFFEAMHPQWQALLAEQKPALEAIEVELQSLNDARSTNLNFAQSESAYLPGPHQVMRAFETSPDSINVLIVGQDPYPTLGHAIGLAFACEINVNPQPRSLQNIRAEMASDLNISPEVAATVDLAHWQNQGVMLLNRTLTVAPGQANSHQKSGWQAFTAAAITALAASRGEQLVVILWGKPAQTVVPLIEHWVLAEHVLTSAHPSPLSARRGFFGSKPFSKTNDLLLKQGRRKIDWIG